jgi:hypothetical protein
MLAKIGMALAVAVAIAGYAARGVTGIMPPDNPCRCLPSSVDESELRAA